VARVRRFNRTVTQRIGALDDHYLSRRRPLGEARVLWEIGEDGCDVRTLRARLDLDAGYLSRLLRSLEADGLVTVGAGPTDRRVRTAHLTRKGRRERAELDRRSDDLARSFLAPLTTEEQQRLVRAMSEVERLLVAALVGIDVVDPDDAMARHCLREYFAELDRRFDSGYDPAVALPALAHEMRPPAGGFLVASLRGDPIACGAIKLHGREPAELKRMWVAPDARGLGLGRRMLAALETWAADHGAHAVRLETNRSLVEAIAMYRSSGYREVPAFNDEPYGDHWFEKRLGRRR
jgi:DNA-binding MarR family transcriptional regulator/GNAT superfamily N-acetyltransferase